MGSDKYSLPKPHIPTGSRLYQFRKAWKNISTDKWTQSVIRNGYRIQFRVRPKLTRVVPQFLRATPSDPEKIQLLQTEVKSMLDKHAIEPVSSCHPKGGYYSRLFLVRKKSGGWRPVIDLSRLNRHVITPHFKMETLDSVCLSLRKHKWAISLNLTDAYFHIPINRKSRRFLRFHFMGKTYQFRALPFGLAPAPYVFSRTVKAVVKHCRRMGMRLHSYLDDWLQPSRSQVMSLFHRNQLLSTVLSLGFVPNCSSQSEVFFSGSTFLSRGGTDRPFFGQVNKTGNLDSENAVSTISISQTDSFSSGSNGVYGSSPARWQSPQAYASVVHQGPLVSSGPVLGFSHFPRSLVQQGRNPMAEQGLPVYHGATLSATTRLVSIHGCKSGGLGCPYGRSLSLRPMVCVLADSTHKCPGTQSSHVGSEILPSDNSELSYSAVNRQYDCSGLSEQRRGGAVTNSVFHGDQSVRMVYEKTGVSDSQVCARETKCSGRLAIQERADNPHRVDYPQGDTVSDISILGSPSLRSVCHEVEQSTSGFHFSFSRSTGLGSGCHVSFMGGNDSLCIPSSSTSHEGTSENGERDLFGHPHCTVLGKPSVFPSSAFSASCLSSQDSNSEGSFDPASIPPSSSKPEIYNLHAWLCCREVSRRQDFLRNLPRESVLRSDLPHSLCTIPAGTLGWIGVSSGR